MHGICWAPRFQEPAPALMEEVDGCSFDQGVVGLVGPVLALALARARKPFSSPRGLGTHSFFDTKHFLTRSDKN